MNNEDILNLVYKINDDLEFKVNDENTVTIIEKQNHKIQNFFRRLHFNIPEYRNVKLDEYSSYVFLQINGKNTVKEIGENLDEAYGESTYPLYERLLLFLNHIDVNCNYIKKI